MGEKSFDMIRQKGYFFADCKDEQFVTSPKGKLGVDKGLLSGEFSAGGKEASGNWKYHRGKVWENRPVVGNIFSPGL